MYSLWDWYALPEWIVEVAERLRKVQIEHRPALEVIQRFGGGISSTSFFAMFHLLPEYFNVLCIFYPFFCSSFRNSTSSVSLFGYLV